MCRRLVCLSSVVLVLGVIMPSVARADLIGHWKFDEGAGTTIEDSSGNGHDGVISGDPQWVSGVFGGALDFHTTVGAEIPNFDVTGGTGSFSLAFWHLWDGTGGIQHFLTKSNGWGANTMVFQVENKGSQPGSGPRLNALHLAYQGASQAVLHKFPIDEWSHTVLAYDGDAGTATGYLNGVDVVGPQPTGIGQDIDSTVLIGVAQPLNRIVQGALDDMWLFSHVLSMAEIEQVMAGGLSPGMASGPNPEDGATDVPRDVVLGWEPGEFSPPTNGHMVYVGETFDDVNDATGGSIQDAASFDPGRLAFDTTYYWRVDEVNGAPDFTVFKGDTWSFTVEPFSYPITDVTATASSMHQATMGPEKSVDGSGLDDMDQHSTVAVDMWLSGMGDAAPWIQYEFDRAYKLHEMWVWNSNQMIEAFVGLGAKDVTIETSVDGTTWTVLEGTTLFNQATGTATYAANTIIDFAGVMAKHVRVTIHSGHGMVAQYGLSEVRFMFIPTSAREPQPADGATPDGVDVILAWRAGREAAQHEVLLSSDLAAVEDASAHIASTQESMFSPAGLSYDTTYYWQINEVNDAATPTRHQGAIWSFSTPEYRVVDDFEGYNDECDRLFFAWQDGFGHNGSEGIADCAVAPYNGNGTGSIVGHANAPFAERATVHSGKQSMPLEYDSGVSETTLTLDAQNWTANGIQALSLSFHGASGNTGQLYLKINSVELPFNGSAAAISSPFWAQWIVDLGAVATDLSRVNSLTIGIKGASAPGMVYVDDIQLYAQAPGVLGPQDPGTDNLVAHYALENNAQDGSGNGHHGTVEGTPTWISPGWDGSGACMQFGGDSDRITVESFDVTGSGITLAAWIKPSLFLNDARMLSKSEGSSTADHYWAMVLSGTGENFLQFRLRTDAGATTSRTSGGSALALDEWTHVAVAWDASDPVMRQYKNGQEIDGVDKAGSAVATGPGVKIGIGNQSVSAGPDPANMTRPFEGLMDEVRVYSRGLSVAELLYVVSGQ